MKKATSIIGALVIAGSASVANANNFHYHDGAPKKGNVEFKSEQEIERDIFDEIRAGSEENARKFALLNELTQVNRKDPETKDDLNLVKGIPAQVQLESTTHPRQTLTVDEMRQMIKEGDTGRVRPKDYAKIFPVGANIEPIDTPVSITPIQKYENVAASDKIAVKPTLPKKVLPVRTINPNYQVNDFNNHALNKFPTNRVINGAAVASSANKLVRTSPHQRTVINMGSKDNLSRYLAMPNIMNKKVTLPIPQSYSHDSVTGGAKGTKENKSQVKKSVATAKQAVVKNAYADFQNNVNGIGGKHKVNDLLARVAKDTGYKLVIDDKNNKHTNLEISVPKNFDGNYEDVLKAVSSAIKGKGVGKLFLNPTSKTIKIAYN